MTKSIPTILAFFKIPDFLDSVNVLGSRSSLKTANSSTEIQSSSPKEVKAMGQRPHGEVPTQKYLTRLLNPTQPPTAVWSYEMYGKIQKSDLKGEKPQWWNISQNQKIGRSVLSCMKPAVPANRKVHREACPHGRLLGTSPLKNTWSQLVSTRCSVTLEFGLPSQGVPCTTHGQIIAH